MKLFQTLTSTVKEEHFLGISSCSYSEASPHSPEPCLWTDQISLTIFEEGHSRTISMKWSLEATYMYSVEFCKQINIHCLSDLKDQKLPVSAIKIRTD